MRMFFPTANRRGETRTRTKGGVRILPHSPVALGEDEQLYGRGPCPRDICGLQSTAFSQAARAKAVFYLDVSEQAGNVPGFGQPTSSVCSA